MKVLLMGNGSSVMDNEFGDRIDNDFDIVYRVNRFRTRGFEKNVGSKVNGWFVCDNGVQWLENETEEVEGLLLAKDLLPLLSKEDSENLNLKSLIRPASLVPEGRKLIIARSGYTGRVDLKFSSIKPLWEENCGIPFGKPEKTWKCRQDALI